MKKAISLLLVSMMILAMFTGCGGSKPAAPAAPAAPGAPVASDNPYTPEKPLVWKLNSNQNEEETKNSAQGQAYLHLAEEVEKRTNGAWKIELYYSSQLGSKSADLINGAQFGTFQLFNLNCSSWSEYSDAFAILNAPYLFPSEEIAIGFMKSDIGKQMSKNLSEDTGISIAFYCPAGFRNTYNNVRPIHTPADYKGVKMRTMSDQYIVATFEALGASAMSVPYAELYTALQQSLVDGADNPFLNIYNSKHNEVSKYLSETKTIFSVANLCVADNAVAALPAEWQDMFWEICAESQEIGCNTAIDKMANDAKEYLMANMEFNSLTAEEFKQFEEATEGVRAKVKEAIDPAFWDAAMAEIEKLEKELG